MNICESKFIKTRYLFWLTVLPSVSQGPLALLSRNFRQINTTHLLDGRWKEKGKRLSSPSLQGTSQRSEDLSIVSTSSCIPLPLWETWTVTHETLEDTQYSSHGDAQAFVPFCWIHLNVLILLFIKMLVVLSSQIQEGKLEGFTGTVLGQMETSFPSTPSSQS